MCLQKKHSLSTSIFLIITSYIIKYKMFVFSLRQRLLQASWFELWFFLGEKGRKKMSERESAAAGVASFIESFASLPCYSVYCKPHRCLAQEVKSCPAEGLARALPEPQLRWGAGVGTCASTAYGEQCPVVSPLRGWCPPPSWRLCRPGRISPACPAGSAGRCVGAAAAPNGSKQTFRGVLLLPALFQIDFSCMALIRIMLLQSLRFLDG